MYGDYDDDDNNDDDDDNDVKDGAPKCYFINIDILPIYFSLILIWLQIIRHITSQVKVS